MKKILSILFVTFALLLAVGTGFSVKANGPAAENGLNAGKSDQQHLYLYEKEPVNWTVVEDGAWGKLNFNDEDFVFNGHGLESGVEYALVVYDQNASDDPLSEWPGEGPILGTSVANNGGNVNIKGDMVDLFEAKIWLVPTSDINENGTFVAWNPEEYLFEYDRVTN